MDDRIALERRPLNAHAEVPEQLDSLGEQSIVSVLSAFELRRPPLAHRVRNEIQPERNQVRLSLRRHYDVGSVSQRATTIKATVIAEKYLPIH
jgi:hypothetical protein